MLLLTSCTSNSSDDGTTSTATPTVATASVVQPTTTLQSITLGPPPVHRIGVRLVDGVGTFYDTTTGERFTPRGMNYNRWTTDFGAGIADDVLTVDHYDPDTVATDFAAMAAMGFNTVRILIDTCHPSSGCSGTGPTGTRVNQGYLDNLADFLRLAGDHRLVVLVASNTLPDDSWWLHETARLQNEQFESANNEFLNPEAVPVYVDYWRQIVRGLADRGATAHILGYELRQEHHFHANFAPLSLTAGLVTTANGNTYDMASDEEKDRMVDEGLVYWADLLRAEIRAIDPTGLVTVGFFTPNAPNPVMPPDDLRLVRTSHFLRNSTMDFVDLHHYPGNGVDDTHIWENFDVAGAESMPIVLGEFGAIRNWWPDAAAGAAAVMALEVEACRVGFDGFIVWAWRGDLSTDIYWASDGAAEIGQVVAPMNRPDPCQYGEFEFIRFNVARDAVATASSELPGFEADRVVDGRPEHWNAAGRAPQWVEIVLPTPATLDRVELWVAQDPPGPSVHRVWTQAEGGELQPVYTFEGVTAEGDVLVYEPNEPIESVVRVMVETTALGGDLAPAWHEISLYSPFPPD
jgi:hypothetical protein